MINRRNIRIKALQVVYSFDTAGISPTPTAIQKALQQKFDQTSGLLNYLVSFTTEVARYVELYANQKASKHLPTAADLVINIKIAGNNVIWGLMENKSFDQACAHTKIEAIIDREWVKKIFLALETTTEYQQYIANEERTTAEDVAIMRFIFDELILSNEDALAHITELFQNFDDDIEMLQGIIYQTFEKPKHIHFTKIITADKLQYAQQLVATYYEKGTYLMEYITPKLKNWDPERVAKLDMAILHLGVAELLYFETIPVKVTINEYIDVAKEYSTPQSGQFVNGILDSINKDLLRDDKLHKVDFRKF